jgi:PilZ domain-containing protein
MSPTPTLKRNLSVPDRRSSPRFPVSVPTAYATGRHRGQGVIRNVSSGGFFIRMDRVLTAGRPIRLLFDWPTRLEHGLTLQLAVKGKVLRSTRDGTAVELLSYETRLPAGPASSPSAAGPVNE